MSEISKMLKVTPMPLPLRVARAFMIGQSILGSVMALELVLLLLVTGGQFKDPSPAYMIGTALLFFVVYGVLLVSAWRLNRPTRNGKTVCIAMEAIIFILDVIGFFQGVGVANIVGAILPLVAIGFLLWPVHKTGPVATPPIVVETAAPEAS